MEKRSSGLTLIELLVAMSILLIGIYAVARGFPALFGNLESERVRTEMARLAEERLERLKASPQQLPDAIVGHDPYDNTLIPPDIYPDESADPAPPGNPRDDLTWMLGEMFEVPGSQPGEAVSIYPLNLGPAHITDTDVPGDYLQVYRLTRLERLDEAPPDGTVPEGYFYLDPDGYLYAPTVYPAARVDYAWVDQTGVIHGISDEVVDNVNVNAAAPPVRAAELVSPEVSDPPLFANVLPEMTAARGMVSYTITVPDPTVDGSYPPDGSTLGSGEVAIDPRYGATIALPSADAGEHMHVNYQLKLEQDLGGQMRRAPVMMEEFSAPTDPPYQRDLKFGGIDDEQPLFETALDGATALDPPVYCLIVDLMSGATWTDADDWVTLEMTQGTLTLDWENAPAPMTPSWASGRDLRVYYRTLDGHTVAVQKAPAFFVEEAVAGRYGSSDQADYRTYSVQPSATDNTYTELVFPESAAGQTVFVDYVVGTLVGGSFEISQRINGEMHVVDGESLTITLNEPVADATTGEVGILGVQGASLTVRGWWHDQQGRVQRISLETFLTPEPLL